MALQTAPEIVIGFAMKPNELHAFLVEAIGMSPKLQVVNEDQGNLKIRFAKLEKDKSEYHIDLVISYEGKQGDSEMCDLHFTTTRPEDSQKLAKAVAAVLEAISKHGQKINKYLDNLLCPKTPTDADIERVATFLQQHRIATIEQISNALGMLQVTVAMILSQLHERGIIGRTDRAYYFK